MIIELHAKTDVGRVRRANEDNMLVLDLSSDVSWSSIGAETEPPAELRRIELGHRGLVMVVSDGMGGALAGDVASRMAIESLSEMLIEGVRDEDDITVSTRLASEETSEKQDSHGEAESSDGGAPEKFSLADAMLNATVYANLAIHRKGREEARYNGMGATLTSAAIANDHLGLVQVGDSRAYLLRGDNIKLLTKDQSLVQQLIDVKQITEEQAETHMFRNVITQALGAGRDINPVVSTVRVRQGDTLLICSDGLSGKLRAADMHRIVKDAGDDISSACQELVDEANRRGGEDNITVVLARFTGEELKAAESDEIVVSVSTIGDDTSYATRYLAESDDITLNER
ncbi:MAG: protein phosphatase 2C domain-containing protein [Pyrinomonadaceae bacterium MAG19_C2-C3]|nr:protein phosphatase 2C domain-containing protein [Pyrinomonadaceae bacterium MAG19_C2-C3]